MATKALGLKQYTVVDPIITTVVQGYSQVGAVAPFIAPAVPVPTRAGKIIRFGKEQFIASPTRRSPGDTIKRIRPSFGSDSYYIEQRALGAEVTYEQYEEANNGGAQIDLRAKAVLLTAEVMMSDWERDVISAISDPAMYEDSCTTALSGTSKISNPGCDLELLVDEAKEAVRAQTGVYPNSAVLSPLTFKAMKRNAAFRDRIKYTSSGSVNLDMLATWFDLPRGIRVASRVTMGQGDMLEDIMGDTFTLFYSPEGTEETGDGFLPNEYADNAKPAFAYTYTLNGYPVGTPERVDEDRRVFITDLIWESETQLVGMGATGKVGAGFLFTDCI